MKIFSTLRKLFTREPKPTNRGYVTIRFKDMDAVRIVRDGEFPGVYVNLRQEDALALLKSLCATLEFAQQTVFRHLGPPPVSPAEGAYKVGDLWIDNSDIKSGGFSKIYRWNGSSWDLFE